MKAESRGTLRTKSFEQGLYESERLRDDRQPVYGARVLAGSYARTTQSNYIQLCCFSGAEKMVLILKKNGKKEETSRGSVCCGPPRDNSSRRLPGGSCWLKAAVGKDGEVEDDDSDPDWGERERAGMS